MHVATKRGFYYHADASALGGHLTQPLQRTVRTRSSVSLAQAGGFGAARHDRFDLDGLLCFQNAQVSVSGLESHEDNGWRSVATASVEGLNILNVVTADRLVSQVSVVHFHEEHRPPAISFVGTQFVNLRLNGRPLDPTLHEGLLYGSPEIEDSQTGQAPTTPVPSRYAPLTFDTLLERLEREYDLTREAQREAATVMGSRFASGSPQANLNAKGSALCSLVKDVTVAAPATHFNHAISLPDFGNIFLGELRLTRFSAQLTMVRVEMGCIASGQLSAATAFSNGSTMP